MTSPGMLLLLLVLSSLPVPSIANGVPQGVSSKEQATTEPSKWEGAKNWFKTNYKALIDIITGSPLKTIAKFLLLFFPDADKLHSVYSEVKASYSKLDTVNAEVKWVDYQKAINNVEHAWIKYDQMMRDQQIKGEKLKDFFLTFYSQYADSSLVLYQYLTAKPTSITQTLGDLQAERLRCHEADVNQQFDHLNELMVKGNELDKRYYELKELNPAVRVKTGGEIASDSAKALFESQKQCIVNIDRYVAMDVFDRIDDSKNHQTLAGEIMQFLNSNYNRYVWMVVAFSTHNSKNLPNWRKLHILNGFTEVRRGTVSVAVAKQVKGSNTKVRDVKKAISDCFTKTLILCTDIEERLKDCKVKFLNKPVSEIYTAVHTYRIHDHTSTNAEPLPEDEEDLTDSAISPSDEQAYMYKGDCKIKKVKMGTFMILIKSEEEIRGDDPCLKISCKNKGKCVKPDEKIAMCECLFPFYGAQCEKSLEEYKTKLKV